VDRSSREDQQCRLVHYTPLRTESYQRVCVVPAQEESCCHRTAQRKTPKGYQPMHAQVISVVPDSGDDTSLMSAEPDMKGTEYGHLVWSNSDNVSETTSDSDNGQEMVSEFQDDDIALPSIFSLPPEQREFSLKATASFFESIGFTKFNIGTDIRRTLWSSHFKLFLWSLLVYSTISIVADITEVSNALTLSHRNVLKKDLLMEVLQISVIGALSIFNLLALDLPGLDSVVRCI